MNKTETVPTVSEKEAARLLEINRATLRYYRTQGYLADGLVLPPDEDALVPPGRTSALRYNAKMVEEITARRTPLFQPGSRPHTPRVAE